MTHTLHLPPALSEIYGGPRPGWLREILDYLPCLQSLMVSQLPFFDHNAMTSLKGHSSSTEYNIRLLLADREPNATYVGLAEALLRFPALIYLDLSYTKAARHRNVLSSLSQLEHLRVLKLRSIGLKDNDAEFLANAIGSRVRFLDLRNNMLTDMAVRSLLQASFLPSVNSGLEGPSPQMHSPEADFLRRPDLDEQFIKVLAKPLTNRLWIDDLPPVGITHLYIADNHITVEGVGSLLASARLHALDFGTVNTADIIRRSSSPLHDKSYRYPGAEKLVPLLGKIAGDTLTYFRAHHAVVTAELPTKDIASPRNLLPELQAAEVSRPVELDASQEVHELPAEMPPIYELADTSVTEPGSSTARIAKAQHLSVPYEDERLPDVRRGSAFAPEVVQPIPVRGETMVSDATDTSISTAHHAEGEGTLSSVSAFSTYSETQFADTSPEFVAQCTSPVSMDDPRARKIQDLLAKRPQIQSIPLQNGKASWFPFLHPSHVPRLETLVLTDVPSHVDANSPIFSSLIRFITACSNEALLANLQAGSDYSLPPGRARLQAEQQRARSLFGLRRLVLEITPPTSYHLSSWKPANQYNDIEHSSTGDRDSEALWAAATDDFSFFDEDECGIFQHDQGKYDKVSLMPSDDDSTNSGTEAPLGRHVSQRSVTSAATGTPSPSRAVADTHPQSPMLGIDLVAELSAFRRAKKAEYEQVVLRERKRRSTNGTGLSSFLSPSSPVPSTPHISIAQFVEGHWKGEVKVIRKPAPN